ncbi:MAG: hypothetical protein ACREST_09835, partial [Steroidobacteraceae bacterium]
MEGALPQSWARAGAGEPPAVALIKEHLNSAIVAGMLLLAVAGQGQRFGGHYVALAAFAYAVTFKVMTRPRLERIGNGLDWGRMLRHRTIEWVCVIGVLLLTGYLLNVGSLYPKKFMLAWFVLTPLALTAAHAAARTLAGWLLARGGIRRRQVIVGANRIGCELAARLAEEPWHGSVDGFFDDRRAARLPRESRPLLLGKFADLPEYARQRQVHVIYVCLP